MSQPALSSPIRILGVIGIPHMGQNIAELAASRGLDVIVVDQGDEQLAAGREGIRQTLRAQLAKWAVTEAEIKVTMDRIHFSTNMADLSAADVLLECTLDNLRSKQQRFRQMVEVARPDAILASNTSTLSITELAAASGRPQQVIGLHFPHPVPRNEVVELVRGLHTSDETVHRAVELIQFLGSTPVEVYESAGYITTRLIAPLINEAIHALMEGVATAEGIDTAMRLGFQMKYGPLELADRMGLDVVLLRLERLWSEYGDLKYRPALLLKKLVRAGNRGVTTGQGFFAYAPDGRRLVSPPDGRPAAVVSSEQEVDLH